MKKFVYISGIIAANLMFLGAIFKVMHWPGASIMLVLSIFTLCFLFLPFGLYTAYQKSESKKYKASYIVSYIVFSIVFIGALFKIQHWPGAGFLMVIGIPLPIILFLPVYLYQTRKDKKYSMINFMGIMFGMTFIAVFSAMLSINISASILQNFEDQYESNQSLIEHLYQDNGNHNNQIHKEANKICQQIQTLKSEILIASGNEYQTLQANPLYESTIVNKDNINIPIRILWLSKEQSPVIELKQNLSKFNRLLADSKNIRPEQKQLCQQLLNVEPVVYGQQSNKSYSWEGNYFGDKNLVMTLDVLTRLERNLRFVQMELIKT